MKKLLLFICFILWSGTSISEEDILKEIGNYQTSRSSDVSADDSCIDIGVGTNQVKNISLLGLYSYLYSNSTNCNSSENKTISFNYGGHQVSLKDGDYWQTCNNGNSHQTTIPAFFIASKSNNRQLCVFVWLAEDGYFPISCVQNIKKNVSPIVQCRTEVENNSAYVMNISSIAVNCTKSAIYSILGISNNGGSSNIFSSAQENHSNTNSSSLNFNQFQQKFRLIIFFSLVIFVIFQGYKTVMNHEITSKAEWFMFVFKYIMVVYFTTGFPVASGEYIGGIQSFFIPLVINTLDTLSFFGEELVSNVMSSASTFKSLSNTANPDKLCDFTTSKYPTQFQYLRIWDTIDCRLISYLGITINQSGDISSFGAIPLIILCMIFFGVLCAFLIILLLSYVISLVVFCATFYITCLTILAILIFVSPIIIPFALFDATKKIFTDWLQLVISYTIQPMIVISFSMMIFTIIDHIYFPGCTWQKEEVNYTNSSFFSEDTSLQSNSSCEVKSVFSNQNLEYNIQSPLQQDQTNKATKYTYIFNSVQTDSYKIPGGGKIPCAESFGAFMHFPFVTTTVTAVLFIFQAYTGIWGVVKSLILSVIIFIICTHISRSIARFAADLTSGIDLTNASFKANAVYDLAKKMLLNKASKAFKGNSAKK